MKTLETGSAVCHSVQISWTVVSYMSLMSVLEVFHECARTYGSDDDDDYGWMEGGDNNNNNNNNNNITIMY
jgi:hypothetical protein